MSDNLVVIQLVSNILICGKENFSTMYTYDRQANITRMKKYGLVEPLTGEYGVIDDLFLAYEGNQAILVDGHRCLGCVCRNVQGTDFG